MTKRLFAPLLLSVLLAACGGGDTTAPVDAATAPAPAAAGESAAVADEPALTGEPDTTAPAAVDATATDAGDSAAGVAADAAPVDPAVDAAVASAAQAAQSGPALVRGTDYVEIPGGQPFAPLDGQVEVVEVFAYSCGHCAAFDPLVNAWKRRLPADVRFTLLPGVFSANDNFPKAFFAAEAIGVIDQVHTPLFNALHTERRLRPNASTEDIIAYMARHGADAGQLRDTVDSFAVNTKIQRTRQFIARTGVDSTPTMIVNGKYRVRGRSLEDVLRITDQLVARERASMQAGGAH